MQDARSFLKVTNECMKFSSFFFMLRKMLRYIEFSDRMNETKLKERKKKKELSEYHVEEN